MNYCHWMSSTGEMILVDDGKLIFEVIESNGKDSVKTRVIAGGTLSNRKGVNLPNTKVTLPSLTEKDIKDARFALDHKVTGSRSLCEKGEGYTGSQRAG